ncbi:hypothetical protein [Sphingomonas sp. S2-65]|uniref:hypothetical protein n=1 Tax=Sphingomonas sp. S2-65 TaxID=2903960 RepID=UPI001F2DA956|nr:hypothetical protein [Sphingomonas sp. S2-65]UYY58309.1 hypothetical protein LZ586_16865 [Sphingomonas sp. S2-65]
MSFSYTLFLALLLLAPGLGLWAGLRAGERSELISQAPEKAGSTFSLLVIVFGALVGHILLSGLFAVQAGACGWSGRCLRVGFDPNVYRVILTNGRSAGVPSDGAFLCWFVSLLLPAVIVGAVAYRASGWRWVRDLRETASFGWLKRWVDQARPANRFIIAYVVTTLEHDGANVAYEGIAENIALDDNRAIKMLVLSSCDRFLVRVRADTVERINAEHAPIPLIQLEASNFVNVALEVFEDVDTAVDADDA